MTKIEYRVFLLKDDEWAVEETTHDNYGSDAYIVYAGALANCESYIRLKKEGYL